MDGFSEFDFMDSFNPKSEFLICDKCDSKAEYVSTCNERITLCEKCYEPSNIRLSNYHSDNCLKCFKPTCNKPVVKIVNMQICNVKCNYCENNKSSSSYRCNIKLFCEACDNISHVDKLNLLMRKLDNDDILFNEFIINIAPRHEDVSHLPLEILENIVKTFDEYFMVLPYHYPQDFGTIKNWYSFMNKGDLYFLINIKDLRVAFYHNDIAVIAFNSYAEYKEALNAWDSVNDFHICWALQNGFLISECEMLDESNLKKYCPALLQDISDTKIDHRVL